MLRETRSILDAGLVDKIVILATHEAGFEHQEKIDEHRAVIRIPLFFSRFSKNLLTEALTYVELLLRSVWLLRRSRVSHVNAHSLSVLPTAFVFRLLKRSKIIYDAHELETERFGLAGMRKRVSKLMERTFMPFVSQVIVVGPSIADWYRQAYPGKPVHVVRNIPDGTMASGMRRSVLREKSGAKDDEILLLYQGLLTKGRAIEMLLEAIAETRNKSVRAVFMGDGPLGPQVRDAADQHDNVSFIPAVPPDEVLEHTIGADVGVCAIENICLSYHLSLPNKLFEYIAAGLPLVIFPRPDQQVIVEECGNGWVIEEDANALTAFLDNLDRAQIESGRHNARISMQRFSWHEEARRYAAVYG